VGDKSISGKLLESLKKAREILAVSVDIKKAAVEYLPIILAIKGALESLKLLG
jgi:hypothetical protein